MTDLTFSMVKMLAKTPAEWGPLPTGVYDTNRTLCALERRELVEVRYRPRLQWRKASEKRDGET